MRKTAAVVATVSALLGTWATAKSAHAFDGRNLIDTNVLSFKPLHLPSTGVPNTTDDCCIVYVLGTDHKLWREDYANGPGTLNRTWVADNVIDFQPWDGQTVYVLTLGNWLWRVNGNTNNGQVLVDLNVADFQALDANWVYVRGTDNSLWLEDGNSSNQSLVDHGILKYQGGFSGTTTFLGNPNVPDWVIYLWYGVNIFSNDTLFRAQSVVVTDTSPITTSWTWVTVDPSNVAAFSATSNNNVYVLGNSGILWKENGTSSSESKVDSTAQSFAPWSDASPMVLVLGTDRKLWREHGNEYNRDFVDSTVFVDMANPTVPYFAWVPNTSSPSNDGIFVLGYDNKLWLEYFDNPPPPPSCTPQGRIPTSSMPCCPGMNTVNVNSCQPADGPGECGHPAAPDEHCCRHSTPCVGATTCVLEPGDPNPFCVINTVPPSPQSPLQSGGVSGCTMHDCLQVCFDALIAGTMKGVEYGQFCNSQLAAAAADAQWETGGCDACCGAECAASEIFKGSVSMCNSAARGGWGPDGVCL
jgi:hypothetical protein